MLTQVSSATVESMTEQQPPKVTLPPGVLCDAPNGDEPHAAHGKCPGLAGNVPSYILLRLNETFDALTYTDAYAEIVRKGDCSEDINQLLSYAKADVMGIINQIVEDLY